MLQSMKIQNYRGFRRLEMDDIGAVNIVVGKNNSGKTSLLEAIFLLAGGNADYLTNPHILRPPEFSIPVGAAVSGATVSAAADQATASFLAHLFHNRDMADPITIETYLEERGSATLRISVEQRSEIQISLERSNSIKVELFRPGKNSVDVSRRVLDENGHSFNVGIANGREPLFSSSIHLSKGYQSELEYAQLMGNARRRKKGDLVLDALKIIEPQLQSVEDNSYAGSPIILCDIGQPELVPLSVMGGGMTEIVSIILSLIAAEGGVALIDEVENGIHHSVQSDVWAAIDEAARLSETQIFAATHSLECVRAAHKSIGADRLRLHRLQKKDGEIRCVTYSQDAINGALKFNLEVR